MARKLGVHTRGTNCTNCTWCLRGLSSLEQNREAQPRYQLHRLHLVPWRSLELRQEIRGLRRGTCVSIVTPGNEVSRKRWRWGTTFFFLKHSSMHPRRDRGRAEAAQRRRRGRAEAEQRQSRGRAEAAQKQSRGTAGRGLTTAASFISRLASEGALYSDMFSFFIASDGVSDRLASPASLELRRLAVAGVAAPAGSSLTGEAGFFVAGLVDAGLLEG